MIPTSQSNIDHWVHALRRRHRERRRAYRYPCGLETSYQMMAKIEPGVFVAKVRNISANGVSLILTRKIDAEIVASVDLYNGLNGYSCQMPLRVIYLVEHPEGAYILGGAFGRELNDYEVQGLLLGKPLGERDLDEESITVTPPSSMCPSRKDP
jgi:hypothetical protein